jgi:hypothetical protein
MAKISNQAIANAAHIAGFRGQAAVTAVAVALAESSGDKDVYNGICCHGLWQIHYVHAKRYPVLWAQKYDPTSNARMAFSISSGGKNWQPWEAYTNGAYRQYLDAAKKAVAGGTGLEDTPGFGETAPPLSSEGIASSLLAPIKESGTRIAAFAGGLLLAAAGAILIVSDLTRK